MALLCTWYSCTATKPASVAHLSWCLPIRCQFEPTPELHKQRSLDATHPGMPSPILSQRLQNGRNSIRIVQAPHQPQSDTGMQPRSVTCYCPRPLMITNINRAIDCNMVLVRGEPLTPCTQCGSMPPWQHWHAQGSALQCVWQNRYTSKCNRWSWLLPLTCGGSLTALNGCSLVTLVGGGSIN